MLESRRTLLHIEGPPRILECGSYRGEKMSLLPAVIVLPMPGVHRPLLLQYYCYYCYYYPYYSYYSYSYSQTIVLLMPSERSHTYIGVTTHHHLDTGPRGQPWWCHPIFAEPNDHIGTWHRYLHSSWSSYKQPHSSPFVPAQDVDTHTYPWPGDANSQ